MSLKELVESSNAWDARYNLPICGIHQNPAIYCAYLFKLIKDSNEEIPNAWVEGLEIFYRGCKKDDYIATYPKGYGVISHDDMIGWAYLNKTAALSMLTATLKNGYYGDKEVSRLIFVNPYLTARSFGSCSYFAQINYSLHVLFHWLKYDKKNPQDSGSLKIWLMNEDMEKLPLCAPFIFLWRWRMKKLGVTIHKIFSERYLTEVSVFEMLSRGMDKI